MILRHVFSVLVCLKFAFIHVAVTQGDATIVSPAKTLTVDAGSAVTLECQVANITSHKVTWTYLDHGTTIFHEGQLMTLDPNKYAIVTPKDVTAFNLQILSVKASDQGFYKCEIDGTDQSITIKLYVGGVAVLPTVNPAPLNATDCCVSQGVSQGCTPICYTGISDSSKIRTCTNNIHPNDFPAITRCLSAGSNHESCCLFGSLDPLCIPFCRGEVPRLEAKHLICASQQSLSTIMKCAAAGYATLPNEPQDVSVMPHSDGIVSSLLVSWKPPTRNADMVTSYKVMYKRTDRQKYFSIRDIKYPFARLTGKTIEVGKGYDILVAALAQRGASSPSVKVTVFLPNTSVIYNQARSIDDCCKDRKVSDSCRTGLCQSKTWGKFDSKSLLKCFNYNDDIFTCLAGEQDHSDCCNAFGVSPVCMPLCSGKPPVFNSSLIVCAQQMAVVEACVQQGYGKLPRPPSKLQLQDVTFDSATLKFQPSTSIDIIRYRVMMKEGETDNAAFNLFTDLNPGDHFVALTGLKSDTQYSVHIASETSLYGSLPSETVHFLTYPASTGTPTKGPVVNIPHNFTECCLSKNMPAVCAEGCHYSNKLLSHFTNNIFTCFSHIGDVLSCASGGRDHTKCCKNRNVTDPDCQKLCRIIPGNSVGFGLLKCTNAIPTAVSCFREGVVNLPRYPDVLVDKFSEHTITLKWTPPTSGSLIDYYIVNYKSQYSQTYTEVNTNQTSFILNNLQAGTQYEISVRSVNENGTSASSPKIRQYTKHVEKNKPNFNETDGAGKQYWTNITECCNSSQIPDKCRDQCINKDMMRASSLVQDRECALQSHNILACYANGQNHRNCCIEAGVPSSCLSICEGRTSSASGQAFALCMGHGHRAQILSCFLDNSGLIPNAPTKMTIKLKRLLTVWVGWENPIAGCGQDCRINVYYWKEGSSDSDPPKLGLNIPAFVTPVGLEMPSTGRFTFTLTARNKYGESQRSSLQTLQIESYKKDVQVYLDSNQPIVEAGKNAELVCSATDFNPLDPYNIRWYFNTRQDLKVTTNRLHLNDLDPSKDEGTYSCKVNDSVVEVTNSLFLPMQYSPQYAGNEDNTVPPDEGRKAGIACLFKGFPTTNASSWQKNGGPLVSTSVTKYTATTKKRYTDGITVYDLKIGNVVPADFGIYSLMVSNQFGNSSCNIALKDPNNITDITPKKKDADPKGCCAKNGLSALCQELCTLDIDVAATLKDPKYMSCLAHFLTLIKCGADGRDYRQCCKKSGVYSYCLPFCAGQAPASILTQQDELLQCLGESNTIFTCLKSGHKLLPYPPKDVEASWDVNNQIIHVRWSRPEFNHDRIEAYVIYYKSASSSDEQHSSVNDHLLEYSIPGLNTEDDYVISVAAHNKFGFSLRSEEFTLKKSVSTVKPDADESSSGEGVAIGVGVAAAILVVICVGAYIVVRNRRQLINPQTENSVAYQNFPPKDQKEVTITQ